MYPHCAMAQKSLECEKLSSPPDSARTRSLELCQGALYRVPCEHEPGLAADFQIARVLNTVG